MPVKIRLARRGRRKRPFYHIVVADVRAPRDGRFIEQIGSYNPMTNPATIELDREKAYEWLMEGAQPTYTARAILRFKGVLYKKHLQRGVVKGALTQEKADEMFAAWCAEKDAKVSARLAQSKEEKLEFQKLLSGEVKAAKKKTAEAEDQEAFRVSEDDGSKEPAAEEAAPEVAVEAEAAPEVAVEAEAAPEVAVEAEAVPEVAVEAEAVPEVAVEAEAVPEVVVEAEAVPEVVVEAEAVPEVAEVAAPEVAVEAEAEPVAEVAAGQEEVAVEEVPATESEASDPAVAESDSEEE